MFAAYMAADGALEIVSGLRAMRRGLIFEGATNLALVGSRPHLAGNGRSGLCPPDERMGHSNRGASGRSCTAAFPLHGRWLLALAGGVSGVWGALVATVGPSSGSVPWVGG
jgi:hypothetical protein